MSSIRRVPLLPSTPLGSFFLLVLLGWVASATGCGGGGGAGGSNIPGIGSSVPTLADETAYVGPRMSTLRYSHTATVLTNGDVLVIGGTDERHLTAVSEVELFVQDALVPTGVQVPETLRGDFLDQTVDGDLMELPGGVGRFWHTANRLTSNRVVVIGGTTGVQFGTPNDQTVIYDPLSRTFDEPSLMIDPADDIAIGRARHTTTALPNGDLLIVGGQTRSLVSLPGQPQQAAYASVVECEIFDPGTLTFFAALDGFGNPVELASTNQGRAGHAAVRLGGFDNLIGTGDDLVMFSGGFETLSPGSFAAPVNMTPWQTSTTKLGAIDFYFSQNGTMNLASGVSLSPRVNHPVALNLGSERPQDPFGENGMTNVVLLFGGDSDEPCPEGASPSGGTTDRSELVVVSHTGFGPANGATFREIAGADMINPGAVGGTAQSNTFDNGHEILIHDLAISLGCLPFNRSATDGVILEIPRTYDNNRTASIVFTAGGIDVTNAGACVETVASICGANEIGGYAIFDPFWDPSRIGTVLPLVSDTNGDGDPDFVGYDSTDDISFLNPTGTTGSWLSLDTLLPGPSEFGYADGADLNTMRTTAMRQARAFHTVDRIPGEDGVLGNGDDRVIIIGGSGTYFPNFGAAASSISCEIYVPPGAGP